MVGKLLPQPEKGARARTDFSRSLLSMVPIAGGPLSEFIRQDLERRIEQSLPLVLDEIEKIGVSALSDLTDGQREYFIPQAYIFLEQIRMAEYRHNLRVLAKLIAGDLTVEPSKLDNGKIARAAQRLRGLTREALLALSLSKTAFEIAEALPDYDGQNLFIGEHLMREAYTNNGISLTPLVAQEMLHELSVRGLLTSGSSPRHLGGSFYFKNSAYGEVIDAVQLAVAEVAA